MGEAKRREELGLPPREKKKEKQTSKNQLNKILNNYSKNYFSFCTFNYTSTILL